MADDGPVFLMLDVAEANIIWKLRALDDESDDDDDAGPSERTQKLFALSFHDPRVSADSWAEQMQARCSSKSP